MELGKLYLDAYLENLADIFGKLAEQLLMKLRDVGCKDAEIAAMVANSLCQLLTEKEFDELAEYLEDLATIHKAGRG